MEWTNACANRYCAVKAREMGNDQAIIY